MKNFSFSLITAAILAAGAASLPAYAEPAASDAKPPVAMKMAPGAMMKHRMGNHMGHRMGHGMQHEHCSCPMGGGGGHMTGGMGMGGMGQGMMDHGHGMGMMGGMQHSMGMAGLGALKLTDEQRGKVNKLGDELRKKHWVGQGAIMDESAKLRDLYAAEKRDPAAIGQVYQRIFDQQRQMIEANIDTQNRIEEVLTPEQRDQLRKMKREGAACNCPH